MVLFAHLIKTEVTMPYQPNPYHVRSCARSGHYGFGRYGIVTSGHDIDLADMA